MVQVWYRHKLIPVYLVFVEFWFSPCYLVLVKLRCKPGSVIVKSDLCHHFAPVKLCSVFYLIKKKSDIKFQRKVFRSCLDIYGKFSTPLTWLERHFAQTAPGYNISSFCSSSHFHAFWAHSSSAALIKLYFLCPLNSWIYMWSFPALGFLPHFLSVFIKLCGELGTRGGEGASTKVLLFPRARAVTAGLIGRCCAAEAGTRTGWTSTALFV